jgi:hypothetical protein
MTASFVLTALLFVTSSTLYLAQQASQNSQAQETSPAAPPTAAAKPAASKNTVPVKVWTNDDLPTTTEPASPSNGQKKGSKQASAGSQDSSYTAGVKKQLDKLQDQLANTEKQLAGLKSFRSGENVSTAGVDVHQGINRTPVDQQIASLEMKKKQLQSKIDDLLDEARKKGVEPGQLR